MAGDFYGYDDIMLYNGTIRPSTVHCANTRLVEYFAKYLTQRAISLFEWRFNPLWDRYYILYSLYLCGNVTFLQTDTMGVIPQFGAPYGYNVFYAPRYMRITNPVIGTYDLEIGVTCQTLFLQPGYCGISDIIYYYADLLGLCAEAVGMNLVNSKLSYIFVSGNKANAESFKVLYDRIASGEVANFIDKSLLNEDGSLSWQMFNNDIKSSFIADDVLLVMQKLVYQFDTEVGIPNANTDKRERLITDEVNANNFETESKVRLWYDNARICCERIRDMFGLTENDLSVSWRNKEGGGLWLPGQD